MAAFPGIRHGRPFGDFALVWALEEERRREIAWIELGDDRTLTARGRQWCTGESAYLLEYELETTPGYVTERLHVRIDGGPELTLARGSGSRLDGMVDCDLGFSPLTNAMPVLRGGMQHGGEARAIDVAWVSVPDLNVHRDHQIYEPLGGGRLRFSSPGADFERVIELTPDGFVRDYPGIGRLMARFTRKRLA
ncbi:MAG: uncharacterized protein QOD65_493 [Gaiellales bacterium]|nr:uncharacterized protein [Gaiellales bacterium]